MKRVALLLAFGILLEAAAAPAAPQRRPRRRGPPAYYNAFQAKQDEGRFSRVVLRNGLTILVEEETIRPLAAVVTYVKAGDSDGDRRGTAGALAAKILAASDLDSQTRAMGGFLSSDVADGHSAFVTLGPADNVLAAIDAHAGLMASPGFEGGIPAPRRAAPEQASDSPLARLRELTGFAADAEDASATFDEAELKAFHRAHYVPGNVVLAVSGAVTRERIFERAVARYGNLKASEKRGAAATAAATGQPPGFRYLQTRGRTSAARVLFGYRTPAPGHPDHPAMRVLAAIVGEGRGSLLRRSLADEETVLAAGVRARLEDRRGKAYFEIEVDPAPGKLDAAEIRCLTVLKALADKTLVEPELERAKALLVRRAYQGIEAVQDRALRMALGEHAGQYLEMEREPARILAVTAEQVARAAEKYLGTEGLALVESLPEGAEAREFTPERLLETWALLLPADLATLGERMRSFHTLRAAVAAELPVSFEPNFLDSDLKRTSVLRGPDVFLEEEHVVPLVELGLFFPGGRLDETAENAGATELMLRAVLARLRAEKGAALWADLERTGADVSVVNQPDYFGFRATLLGDNLPTLLGRMLDWFRVTEFDSDAVAQARREVELEAAREAERAGCGDGTGVAATLFKDHPYGRGRYGDAATWDKLDAEAVGAWMKRQVEGFHPVILVRGDVEGTSFLTELIPKLSNSKLKRKPIPERAAPDPGRMIAVCRDPAGGSFQLATPGPARGTRDAWTLDVLEGLTYLLGGLPSEDQSERPYRFARLSHLALSGGGAVIFRADTAAGATMEEAETAARRDLGALETAPIRDTQALGALVVTITRFHDRQQDGERYLLHLANQLLAGEKPGYREEYLTTIKSLGAGDLRTVAGRYFPKPPPVQANQEQQQP